MSQGSHFHHLEVLNVFHLLTRPERKIKNKSQLIYMLSWCWVGQSSCSKSCNIAVVCFGCVWSLTLSLAKWSLILVIMQLFFGYFSTQQHTPQEDDIPFRCTALQVAAFYGQVGFGLLWPFWSFWFKMHGIFFFIQNHTNPRFKPTWIQTRCLDWYRGPYSCGFCFYLGPTQYLSPQRDSSRCFFLMRQINLDT